MKTAIAAFLVLLALPTAVLAGTYTFKSCSADTNMTVNSYNYNDPVKMFPASSAQNVRENDQRTLTCETDKCLARVTVEFLGSQQTRVRHDVKDLVPDGGSVCLRIRAGSWNTAVANVSYGNCSC